jgi:hypothetical protein
MNYAQVLEKLETNEITPELAYSEIYPEKKTKPGKRAFFVKLRVHIPEEGAKLNTFLRILFMIPIPIFFARIGLSFANRYANLEDQDIDFKEISRLLKYSKHTRISVDTEDAKIDIRVI